MSWTYSFKMWQKLFKKKIHLQLRHLIIMPQRSCFYPCFPKVWYHFLAKWYLWDHWDTFYIILFLLIDCMLWGDQFRRWISQVIPRKIENIWGVLNRGDLIHGNRYIGVRRLEAKRGNWDNLKIGKCRKYLPALELEEREGEERGTNTRKSTEAEPPGGCGRDP